jgi:hypothetical protein
MTNQEYARMLFEGIRQGNQIDKAMTSLDKASAMMGGQDMLKGIVKRIPVGQEKAGLLRNAKAQGLRLAGDKLGRTLGRALPIISGVTAVGDVGDILTNDTSGLNKGADALAMLGGGTIGAVVGLGNPFAIAAGASLGKTVSDGVQYIFGDKKTPEERRIEEVYEMMQGGRYS